MDVIAVYEAAKALVERARKGEGPSLLECKTYRYMGHSRGDPPVGYRTKEELESWKKRDAIKKLRLSLKITDAENARIIEEISEEYEEAIKFAQESPYPSEAEAMADIYA